MNVRTLVASIIGVLLGTAAGYTVAFGGYGASLALLFWLLVGPLIVCRIANQNIILVGMIPNVMMALTINVILAVNHPAGPFEVLAGFVFWIVATALLSLPISVPTYLLRNYLRKLRLRKIGKAKFVSPPSYLK